MTIELFSAELAPTRPPLVEGTAAVRVMPYGAVIDHNGRRVTYDPGSIAVPELVPVVVDHGAGAAERVGLVTRHLSDEAALYADVRLSQTTLGRDVHTLLKDGVLTDVSAGIEIDPDKTYTDADGVTHLHGRLDHIAIVGEGAFSPQGARVLAVHTPTQEANVPTESDPTPEVDPAAPAVLDMEQYQKRVDDLERQVARLSVPDAESEPQERLFKSLRHFVDTQRYAAMGRADAMELMAKHVASIGDVEEYALGDDTTTTAVGIVPDYLSSKVIGLIDDFRPTTSALQRDPAGDHGMSVVYPEVKVKPDVDTQATQNTEVASQAMDIDPKSVPLVTYAGASQVAMQLIERSQPSFLDRLFRELAGVYAERTDAAHIAAIVAGAGNTAIVADLSTSASTTYAAVAAAAGDVYGGIKRPANTMITAVDRFIELASLVDSEGRPLINFPGSGPANAQGLGSLSSGRFEYAGLNGIVDPHAADGTCAVMWAGAAGSIETGTQQVRAVQAGLLAVAVGVWGLFAPVVYYADGISTITPS